MKRIISEYRKKYKENDDQRKYIDDRIELRKKQIERLEKKRSKLGYVYWTKEIVQKIGERLIKHYPGYYFEILGPFGLSSATSIHIYKNGWKELKEKHDDKRWKKPWIYSITFIPLNLSEGTCLGIRDHSKDTKEYKEGTIGYMNGFNHPTIPLKNSTTIKELLQHIK